MEGKDRRRASREGSFSIQSWGGQRMGKLGSTVPRQCLGSGRQSGLQSLLSPSSKPLVECVKGTTTPGSPLLFCHSAPSLVEVFHHLYLRTGALEPAGGRDVHFFFFKQSLYKSINSYLCLSPASCHTRASDIDSSCLLGAQTLMRNRHCL